MENGSGSYTSSYTSMECAFSDLVEGELYLLDECEISPIQVAHEASNQIAPIQEAAIQEAAIQEAKSELKPSKEAADGKIKSSVFDYFALHCSAEKLLRIKLLGKHSVLRGQEKEDRVTFMLWVDSMTETCEWSSPCKWFRFKTIKI
jgi:hypothetical protein